MTGQLDHHVQAWVKDRVRVLEMLEELSRLQTLRELRETRAAQRASAETVECTRAAVRGDGEVVYLDRDKKCRVVVDYGD